MQHPKHRTVPYLIILIGVLLYAYARFIQPGISPFENGFFVSYEWFHTFTGWPTIIAPHGINPYYGSLLFTSFITFPLTICTSLLHMSAGTAASLLYNVPSTFLGALGMWQLLKRRWSYAPWIMTIGSLIYGINSFILTLQVGGQMIGAVAYGAIPWVIVGIDALIDTPRAYTAAQTAIALFIIGIYEPRYIVITAIIAGIWLITRMRDWTKPFWKYAMLAILLFLAASSVWIIGTFAVPNTALAPTGIINVGWLDRLSYDSFWQSLALHHIWWKVGDHAIFWLFYSLPVISIAALYTKKYRRLAIGMWTLLIVGVFLSKGTQAPLPELNRWIYLHVPGFSGFRDPAKFLTIVAFAYATLVPIGLDTLYRLTRTKARTILQAVAYTALLGMFIIGYNRLWLQRVDGAFSKQLHPTFDPTAWFAARPDTDAWYRVLWFPNAHRFASSDPAHPAIISVDPLGTPIADVRTLLPGLNQWITTLHGESHLAYVVASYGVRYIAVPADLVGGLYSPTYSQTQIVDAIKAAVPITDEWEMPDQDGTSTYILTTDIGQPFAFSAQQIVITDGMDHPQFDTDASQDPQHTLLVSAETDDRNGYAISFANARYILLQPQPDANALATGLWQWSFYSPIYTSVNLTLLDTPSIDYNLDNTPLTDYSTEIKTGVSYRTYTNIALTPGTHTIQITAHPSSITPIVEAPATQPDMWHPCTEDDIHHLPGLDAKENATAVQTDGMGSLQNSAGATRCVSTVIPKESITKPLQIIFDGDVTSDAPYMVINYEPIGGYTIPLQTIIEQGGSLLLPEDGAEQVRLSIVLPAGSSDTVTTRSLRVTPIQSTTPLTTMELQPTQVPTFATPTITTTRTDTTSYTLDVTTAAQPTLLTTSEAYNPAWKMTDSNNQQLAHFRTLTGLNGWVVPAHSSGPYHVTFRARSLLITAGYLSLGTLIGLAAYLYLYRRKKV